MGWMNKFRLPARASYPVDAGGCVPWIKAARASSWLCCAEAGKTWLCVLSPHVFILWCL